MDYGWIQVYREGPTTSSARACGGRSRGCAASGSEGACPSGSGGGGPAGSGPTAPRPRCSPADVAHPHSPSGPSLPIKEIGHKKEIREAPRCWSGPPARRGCVSPRVPSAVTAAGMPVHNKSSGKASSRCGSSRAGQRGSSG